MNNIDYLVTLAFVSGRDISGSKWALCPRSCCVGSRKNGRIWVSLTRAWVRTSPKLPKKVAWGRTTADIGAGHPRLIDERGEQRLVCVVRSHRRATVARMGEKVATMAREHQNWTKEQWKITFSLSQVPERLLPEEEVAPGCTTEEGK